jgi:hypothetical protein
MDRCERKLSDDTNHNTNYWTELVNESFGVIDGAKKFIGYEVYHRTIFELTPPKAFRKIVESISRLLKTVVHQSIQRGASRRTRRTVKNMFKRSVGLARILTRYSMNDDLIVICKELQNEIAHYREQMSKSFTAIHTEQKDSSGDSL